jgi:hypothetical protein
VDTDVHAGAVLAPDAPPTTVVGETGRLTVPLACPDGTSCTVSGTLTVTQRTAARSARAAAAATRRKVVARFRGVRIAAGSVRQVRLKVPKAWLRAAQKRGVRKVRATLTIRTVFADGTSKTSRQRITLRIPRAHTTKSAVAPAFTG